MMQNCANADSQANRPNYMRRHAYDTIVVYLLYAEEEGVGLVGGEWGIHDTERRLLDNEYTRK